MRDVYLTLWRRLHEIGKEIASMGVVYTKETGATTEREPVVKPRPRPVTAPPKPKPKKRPLPSTDAELLEAF
jgi:hypothetical protein